MASHGTRVTHGMANAWQRHGKCMEKKPCQASKTRLGITYLVSTPENIRTQFNPSVQPFFQGLTSLVVLPTYLPTLPYASNRHLDPRLRPEASLHLTLISSNFIG
jgi:hypothetical protein